MPVTETYMLVPHLLRYVPWFARYFQIPYMPNAHTIHTWVPYMGTIHGYHTWVPYMPISQGLVHAQLPSHPHTYLNDRYRRFG